MSSTWKLEGSDGEVEQHESSSQDNGADMSANPFASFAFDGATATAVPASAPRLSTGDKRKKDTVPAAAGAVASATAPPTGDNPKKRKVKGGKAERIDFGELSAKELREFRARWRGMADRDASVEVQRFQVLVGAVLSSRAQATVVDEGLSRLRARDGGLTAAAMSNIEQDELADILRHVHWNKAKAKHIRESASMIVRRHRGVVPRRKGDLLALPGVGPALVEILLNVFHSWEADDAAVIVVDTCGSSGGSSDGEAGRTENGRTAVDGGGGAAGVGGFDGTRGCGGDTESERNKNRSEDRPVDDS